MASTFSRIYFILLFTRKGHSVRVNTLRGVRTRKATQCYKWRYTIGVKTNIDNWEYLLEESVECEKNP